MIMEQAVQELKAIFALKTETEAQAVYYKLYNLLASSDKSKEKTEGEIAAFVQYRKQFSVSQVLPLTEQQQQENVTVLLQFLHQCSPSAEQILVTSEKALKKDASKLFIQWSLALKGRMMTLDEIEKQLDIQKKEIAGQAEQPVGLEGANECAKTRVSVSVNDKHSHGVTIESFMHDFTEADLDADKPVQDAAVIGLGANSSGLIGANDIQCLLTSAIELPAHFMKAAIVQAEKSNKPKVATGYGVTAGSEFAKEIKGSDGAAWQLLVTMDYYPDSDEVRGLSRRGQMISAFIDTLAHMNQEQVEALPCEPAAIAELIAASLNELKIKPAEMNCSGSSPVSLGLFGLLRPNETTGLFQAVAPECGNYLKMGSNI
ncbi:hypothetical protein [Legionella shakespearei]|uniref:Uncharacterized protein n=1 Tax=Legionella shakespearei DSM 23087 TaxID=1122169 RepID=A0A0W0ZB73_9GAMM|nr:hypothetical protein [Legionella shakespearei]KTD66062.1 hypothetical protein Lsha_0138 [Legionella shakespearei DSM 23087]